MDIQVLRKMKKEAGITNGEIAELSGIPVSTVNKIFSGATKNPRYATLLAIEQVLASREKLPFTYNPMTEEPTMIKETVQPYQYRARKYEREDIDKLSEYTRAELINGRLYMMAAPSRMHQWVVSELLFLIKNHIRRKKGKCKAYASPFDVRLFEDDSVCVQPDILVVCNPDILTDSGCCGAPDWIIEVVSESNASYDYITKQMQYQRAGVKEYWVVDPFQRLVSVMNWECPERTRQYTYQEAVSSGVLEGLQISFQEIEEGF